VHSRSGIAALVVLALSSVAAATPVVTLTLVDSWYDHTWQLYASSSLGDNAGIAAYAVDVYGVTDTVHRAPVGLATPSPDVGYVLSGFTFSPVPMDLRGGLKWGHACGLQLFQSQNVMQPKSVVYGIGQAPGVFQGPDDAVAYDAPVLLESGVYIGPAPIFSPLADRLAVNVFATRGNIACSSAQVQAIVVTAIQSIPEPMTALLLVLGALMCWRRR
jgi:hypothetical protein